MRKSRKKYERGNFLYLEMRLFFMDIPNDKMRQFFVDGWSNKDI